MKRVVTFGELLISLSAMKNQRLVQAEEFAVRYTGAEANVAVSLATLGLEAFAVSKMPAHEIGQACVNTLRRYGVNTGDFNLVTREEAERLLVGGSSGRMQR